MPERPCPICRKPVPWETTPTRPFCSERCKIRDLGAWSSENYRVELAPGSEEGEDNQDASPSSEAF